jgi:cell division protein FtsW
MKLIKLRNHNKTSNQKKIIMHGADIWLIAIIISLITFGIIAVYNSSVAIALRDFQNQYYFVSEQLKWLVVGIAAMLFCANVDYHRWSKFALPFLICTLLLLIAVFIPNLGMKLLGAHRWIKLGFIVIQPAELAKLTSIIYLSTWFSAKSQNRFLPFLVFLITLIGLVIIEPDMGTSTILVCISLIMYFIADTPLFHFLFFIPVFGVGFGFLAAFSPYRFARILSFLNPHADPLGSSYQIRQSLLAIGSGGLFGVGIGQSRQKYEYLPEANTDSIFAIIAEEIGLIGSISLIAIFLFFIIRGLRVARFAPDMLGKYLAIGITSWIGFQAILNLAAMVSFVPLTGIPLPFISYGGSSLIISLTAVGILINISRQTTE